MIRPRILLPALAVLLVAARLCHSGVVWAEEGLPLAAALEVLNGKALYRDIWFDKPPLLAWVYLLWGAHTGVLLRLAGAAYAWLACLVTWRFARDLWGPREGAWAACFTAFFLTFDLPASVLPLASDLLMLVPHVAAVWLAWKGRAFWSGALAGVAFLLNPKGVFVLAACLVWNSGAWPELAAGFAAATAAAALWLGWQGALAGYFEQVWQWGRLYACGTFLDKPLANGLSRTLNWCGFHAAALMGVAAFCLRERDARRRWCAWAALSLLAVTLGWRFFPRYFFQLLPVVILAGARGLAGSGRRVRVVAIILLLVPLVRFGPRYVLLAAGAKPGWADIAMDADSRATAGRLKSMSHPGDTLFVWGFRPEIYAYTRLPAACRFLDSQPLTGVPADRHLTQSQAVETGAARAHRALLTATSPAWIVDGLGLYNPRLAIGEYPDLRTWMDRYREVARTSHSVIYCRRDISPLY